MNSSIIDVARELKVSERAIRRWSWTSKLIGRIFVEYPKTRISLKEFYHIIRTVHLNQPGTKYSEQAIRSALARFVRKGYLVRHYRGKKSFGPIYYATNRGLQVFNLAQEILSSLSKGDLKRVLKADSSETVTIGLRPWRELIGFDSGWAENTRITKVWLDPFIIKQIRTAIGREAKGGNPAQWLTVNNEDFTLQVSKVRTIQLWVKSSNWRVKLQEWFERVPNLEDCHLQQIWDKITERYQNVTIVREFHVTDPALSKSRVDLFRRDRPRGQLTKDDNEVREVPWELGGRIWRGYTGCGQRLCEPRRTVCRGCDLHAHLRTGIETHEGTVAERVRTKARSGNRGHQETVPQTATAGGVA